MAYNNNMHLKYLISLIKYYIKNTSLFKNSGFLWLFVCLFVFLIFMPANWCSFWTSFFMLLISMFSFMSWFTLADSMFVVKEEDILKFFFHEYLYLET